MSSYAYTLSRWAASKWRLSIMMLGAALLFPPTITLAQTDEPAPITLGSILALKGDAAALGSNMKAGLLAALEGQTVQGRAVELLIENDFLDQAKTPEAFQKLRANNVLALVGNTGTSTTEAILTDIKNAGLPMLGFTSGASFLRTDNDLAVNYRASFAQETDSLINAAFNSGVAPTGICAIVPSDSDGLETIRHIRTAYLNKSIGVEEADILQSVLTYASQGLNHYQLNGIGPVGFYKPGTLRVKEAYESLVNWELNVGLGCKVVLIEGPQDIVSNLIAYARYNGKGWVFGIKPYSGFSSLVTKLRSFGISRGLFLTQTVPYLSSDSKLLQQARKVLGEELDEVSLEGFIVGKWVLAVLNSIKGDITSESILQAAKNHYFDSENLSLSDKESHRPSDLVLLGNFENGEVYEIGDGELVLLMHIAVKSIWLTSIQPSNE